MAEVELEDFQGEGGAQGHEEAALLGSGVSGELKDHITTLRAAPQSPPNGLSLNWDGDVWVSSSSKPVWKKKNLFVEGDNFHISTKSTKPERMNKKISYAHVATLKEPDRLAQQQKDLGEEVNSKRVMIFTEDSTVVIAFSSQNETEQFSNRAQEMLQKKYSQDELSKKKHSSDALVPLMSEQGRVQRQIGDYIVNELSKSGLHALSETDMSKTKKQGKLSLKKNGKYVSYHFMVTSSSLRYFHPKSEVPDGSGRQERKLAGVISLPFMSAVDSAPSKKNKKFTIATPLRQYFFKAEHEVAKELWIEALVKARASYRKKHQGYKKKHTGKGEAQPLDRDRAQSFVVDGGQGNEDSSEGENCDEMGKRKDKPSDGDFWDPGMVPSLSYVNPNKGKEKKAVVKPDSAFVVGRSRTCNWVIDCDSKISREHAKFYFNRAQNTLAFFDLGSRRGCHWNGNKVIKTFLKPGDEIQLGETTIHVGATAPPRGMLGLFSGN